MASLSWIPRDAGKAEMRILMKPVALLGAAILIVAACGGAPGQGGDSSAHAVNQTVSFQESAGTTTITVVSARVSNTSPWMGLSGEPITADGIFVIVSLTFDSPWTASQLLEVKGGDGKLYGPRYSDNPQTLRGAAKKDPNHFTEVFDLPREAANGAVLEIHIGRNYDRDPLGELQIESPVQLQRIPDCSITSRLWARPTWWKSANSPKSTVRGKSMSRR